MKINENAEFNFNDAVQNDTNWIYNFPIPLIINT